VELAEITISLGRLPALHMLALAYTHHVRLVLTEVKRLTRMDLTTYCLVEVFVRDLTVSIIVELIKYVLELLRSQIESPMVKVKL